MTEVTHMHARTKYPDVPDTVSIFILLRNCLSVSIQKQGLGKLSLLHFADFTDIRGIIQ